MTGRDRSGGFQSLHCRGEGASAVPAVNITSRSRSMAHPWFDEKRTSASVDEDPDEEDLKGKKITISTIIFDGNDPQVQQVVAEHQKICASLMAFWMVVEDGCFM